VLQRFAHSHYARNVACSADGKWFVVSFGDKGEVRLYEAATGKPQPELQAPEGRNVVAVQFSRDSKQLLTQCGDGTVVLWDITQSPARIKAQRQVHPSGTWFGLLLPDGRTVANGGVDRTIRLWDSSRDAGRLVAEQTTKKSDESGRGVPDTRGWHEHYRAFKGRPQDTEGFVLIGPDADQCVKFEPAGLRFTLPQGHPGKRLATGLAWSLPIKGDFEITLGFEILQEPGPREAGQGTGVFLGVDLNTPKSNRATLTRGARAKSGKQFISWYALTNDDSDKPHADVLRTLPADATTGRLRILRVGSILSFFGADGPSGELKPIFRDAFHMADVEQIRLGGYTGGPEASLDARVTDLRIRTKARLEVSAVQEQGHGRKNWLAVGGILVPATGVSFLGLWWFARRIHRGQPSLAAR
jgi:hypothetical protein